MGIRISDVDSWSTIHLLLKGELESGSSIPRAEFDNLMGFFWKGPACGSITNPYDKQNRIFTFFRVIASKPRVENQRTQMANLQVKGMSRLVIFFVIS